MRKGEIATLLTLGLVLVGAVVTLASSFLTNQKKNLASIPRAAEKNCKIETEREISVPASSTKSCSSECGAGNYVASSGTWTEAGDYHCCCKIPSAPVAVVNPATGDTLPICPYTNKNVASVECGGDNKFTSEGCGKLGNYQTLKCKEVSGGVQPRSANTCEADGKYQCKTKVSGQNILDICKPGLPVNLSCGLPTRQCCTKTTANSAVDPGSTTNVGKCGADFNPSRGEVENCCFLFPPGGNSRCPATQQTLLWFGSCMVCSPSTAYQRSGAIAASCQGLTAGHKCLGSSATAGTGDPYNSGTTVVGENQKCCFQKKGKIYVFADYKAMINNQMFDPATGLPDCARQTEAVKRSYQAEDPPGAFVCPDWAETGMSTNSYEQLYNEAKPVGEEVELPPNSPCGYEDQCQKGYACIPNRGETLKPHTGGKCKKYNPLGEEVKLPPNSPCGYEDQCQKGYACIPNSGETLKPHTGGKCKKYGQAQTQCVQRTANCGQDYGGNSFTYYQSKTSDCGNGTSPVNNNSKKCFGDNINNCASYTWLEISNLKCSATSSSGGDQNVNPIRTKYDCPTGSKNQFYYEAGGKYYKDERDTEGKTNYNEICGVELQAAENCVNQECASPNKGIWFSYQCVKPECSKYTFYSGKNCNVRARLSTTINFENIGNKFCNAIYTSIYAKRDIEVTYSINANQKSEYAIPYFVILNSYTGPGNGVAIYKERLNVDNNNSWPKNKKIILNTSTNLLSWYFSYYSTNDKIRKSINGTTKVIDGKANIIVDITN